MKGYDIIVFSCFSQYSLSNAILSFAPGPVFLAKPDKTPEIFQVRSELGLIKT